MEIVIQSGEGISQAIKRTLKSENGVQNKQFNRDAWTMIQTKLNDGKSTLKHKQNEQLIGDLWQPISKNVKTQVNDVLTIDDATWNEILGFFRVEEVQVKAPEKKEAPEVKDVKSEPKAEQKSEIVIKEEEVKPEENAPVQVEEIDIEKLKRDEKKSIEIYTKNLRHDATMLIMRAKDVLVDVANMEDKPDVESGEELGYSFKRVSLSNNRSIEVRTDENGSRKVIVTLNHSDGKTLNVFKSADVVYELNPKGKSQASVIYEYGENDREEDTRVEVDNENFDENMNAILKKLFCE